MNPRVVLVMGVSGSGKSTIGKALADRLGWAFADADDYHLPANREKLSRGEALSDEDRKPWLEQLHELMAQHVRDHQPLVLACSALKAKYRDWLVGDLGGIEVVFLQGDYQVIAERMHTREHFMPVSLLESQLATLEPPANAITVNITQPVETITLELARHFKSKLAQPNGSSNDVSTM